MRSYRANEKKHAKDQYEKKKQVPGGRTAPAVTHMDPSLILRSDKSAPSGMQRFSDKYRDLMPLFGKQS
ncbi:MAG: hypothetical protein JWL87_88 [Candidatus Adlerbacteria bacterium]|nr:hypothetical protein [Candidatus Adlerbacteria bacterium]